MSNNALMAGYNAGRLFGILGDTPRGLRISGALENVIREYNIEEVSIMTFYQYVNRPDYFLNPQRDSWQKNPKVNTEGGRLQERVNSWSPHPHQRGLDGPIRPSPARGYLWGGLVRLIQ